jgi:hypothetical protein
MHFGRRAPFERKAKSPDDIFFSWQLAEGFRIFKNRSSGYWETIKALESILCVFLCASIAFLALLFTAKRKKNPRKMANDFSS